MRELLWKLRGGVRGQPSVAFASYRELLQRKAPWDFNSDERKIEQEAQNDLERRTQKGLAIMVPPPGACLIAGVGLPFSSRTLDALLSPDNAPVFQNAVCLEYGSNSGNVELYGKLKTRVRWSTVLELFRRHEQRLNKQGHGVELFRTGRYFRLKLSFAPERLKHYFDLAHAWNSMDSWHWRDWLNS